MSSSARVDCVLVVATMALAGCSSHTAPPRSATPESHIAYSVRIAEPASGFVQVRAEISRDALAGARGLVIRFRDMRLDQSALKAFRATANDRPLDIDVDAEGEDHARTIGLGGSSGPVIIEYTLDPTFYPPGPRSNDPADARARVGQEIAVLRTSHLFPTFDQRSYFARVTFDLPEGWVAVTPWVRNGNGFWLSPEDHTAVDYLGLGLLDVREFTVDKSAFLIASPRQAAGLGPEQTTAVIRYYVTLVGTSPPQGGGPRSVILAPSGFMRGGAAGRRSIVQESSAVTLAHEVFHWWTHSDLVHPEATWFSEGVTTYYGIKAASETALITAVDAAQCLSDLWGEMTYLELEGVRSLESVSRDYARDSKAQRLVYSKGALFALFLHRELAKHDRSLDEVITTILSQERRGLTNADLRQFFAQEYGNGVASILDAFVTEGRALPDLELGPAAGRSGCARFLPGR